jgi:hypothetical protein
MCSNYKNGNFYCIILDNKNLTSEEIDKFYNDPNLVFSKELVEYVIDNRNRELTKFRLEKECFIIYSYKVHTFNEKLKDIGNIFIRNRFVICKKIDINRGSFYFNKGNLVYKDEEDAEKSRVYNFMTPTKSANFIA